MLSDLDRVCAHAVSCDAIVVSVRILVQQSVDVLLSQASAWLLNWLLGGTTKQLELALHLTDAAFKHFLLLDDIEGLIFQISLRLNDFSDGRRAMATL